MTSASISASGDIDLEPSKYLFLRINVKNSVFRTDKSTYQIQQTAVPNFPIMYK